MRKSFTGSLLTLALVVSAPHPGQAQATGVAFVSIDTVPDPFTPGGPFVGGYRVTETGVDLKLYVTCYDVQTFQRSQVSVIAHTLHGQLEDMTENATTAIVNTCGAAPTSIAVTRTGVLLPAMRQGI